MKEVNLFNYTDIAVNIKDWKVDCFSADNKYPQDERKAIEEKYWAITEITDKFNRQSVSFQLSKKDRMQRWLKYKEGFSAELVRTLIKDFNVTPGQTILDPFMGSGTTALVSCMDGMNSVGFDILPMSKVAINAKMSVFEYDLKELETVFQEVKKIEVPSNFVKETPYLTITKEGYPLKTAIEIEYFTEYFAGSKHSDNVKNLIKLCILNCLEPVSYSIKAGQYLKWDTRCPRIQRVNQKRISEGKAPLTSKNNKQIISGFREELIKELSNVISDIKIIQQKNISDLHGRCKFFEDSALLGMPKMEANSINAVISSPPYCNRYDYTRTYAMELAYLGVDDNRLKELRQELLSCTVESKTKLDMLRNYYNEIGRIDDYNKIVEVINNNRTLTEIISALEKRNQNGEINNKGVLRMVKGYFTELTFIFAEIYRVCTPGSYVGFVNDNVRYAGEVIPVDFLTTQLAEQLGFKPIKIYTLMQKKGNSSQQMAKYGKVSLRKSITIWQK